MCYYNFSALLTNTFHSPEIEQATILSSCYPIFINVMHFKHKKLNAACTIKSFSTIT